MNPGTFSRDVETSARSFQISQKVSSRGYPAREEKEKERERERERARESTRLSVYGCKTRGNNKWTTMAATKKRVVPSTPFPPHVASPPPPPDTMDLRRFPDDLQFAKRDYERAGYAFPRTQPRIIPRSALLPPSRYARSPTPLIFRNSSRDVG
jgi:hypothetical protein